MNLALWLAKGFKREGGYPLPFCPKGQRRYHDAYKLTLKLPKVGPTGVDDDKSREYKAKVVSSISSLLYSVNKGAAVLQEADLQVLLEQLDNLEKILPEIRKKLWERLDKLT